MPLFGPPNVAKLAEKRDLSGLTRALTYKDPQVRRDAATALAKLGDARAVAALLAAITDDDQEVRIESRVALHWVATRLGQDGDPHPMAVEALLSALTSEELGVRERAVAALGRLRDPQVVPTLISLVQDKRELGMRWEAATALGDMGDERAVEPLMAAITDPRIAFKAIPALEKLGKLGDARVVDQLLAALHSEDGSLREQAARALGRSGDPRAAEHLIDVLLGDDEIRGIAASSLHKLGDPRAIEPLAKVFKESAPDAARGWATRLVSFGDEGVEALVRAAQAADVEEELRDVAASVLRDGGYPDAADRVPLTETQREAIQEREAAEVPKLIGILELPGHSGEQAAEKLAVIGAPVIQPLVSALAGWAFGDRYGAGPGTLERAFKVLRNIRDPQAAEPLLTALEDARASRGIWLARELLQNRAADHENSFSVVLEREIVSTIGMIRAAAVASATDGASVLAWLYEQAPEGFVKLSRSGEAVRAVGERVDEIGGFDLMVETHAVFAAKMPAMARNLEMVWDGVGSWSG